MPDPTARCSRCGHSYAFHVRDRDGSVVCSQCTDNDPTAPCAAGNAG